MMECVHLLKANNYHRLTSTQVMDRVEVDKQQIVFH